MTTPMEEILGKGSVETKRVIRGTRPSEEERVRYVSFEPGEKPSELYQSVIRRVVPPLMKHGGVMLDGCILETPTGGRFYALVLNGDIKGWQSQIEVGARELGRLSGRIVGDSFHLSDGSSYLLSTCKAEFEDV